MIDWLGGWLGILPLFVVAAGGLIVMLVDAFDRDKAAEAVTGFVVLGAAAATALGLWFRVSIPDAPPEVGSFLATDKMALFTDLVICSGGLLSGLLGMGYFREHRIERGEFHVLLVFTTFGAMVLARGVDLLSIFIGLETMSLGVYCMVAFRRTNPKSAEAGLKYFLLGSFAAALLLFGMALLYGATGTTALSGIGTALTDGTANTQLTLVAMALIIVGLAFKVSAVPFHVWTPDAYEGAPTPTTTFMSVTVKAAAFAVLLRVMLVAFGDELSRSAETGWPPVIAGLAAVSMIYGNIAALVQTSVKRMLAYSSIAHAGTILVGVAAAFRVEETAVSAVLFYLMAYTVTNVLAFGSLILMGSYRKEAVSYEDLAGVGRRHPMAALPFVLAIVSLIGIPPMAGFFAKYYIFLAAVDAGGGLVWLAIIGVLTSVIGAFYYLRVLVYMFMKQPQAGAPVAVPMRSSYVIVALILSGYFVLKMGITPSPYLDLARTAGTRTQPNTQVVTNTY